MVVCKCRKATKLYCFVHKIPLCLDCVCSPEHAICVVGQYSEWVNDGDYDWPPKCSVCSESLEETSKPTIRLACLHVLHTECLEKHLSSYPAYTAPAGYTCPACNSPIWPMKSQKDSATTLYTSLRSFLSKNSAASILLAGATIQASEKSFESPPPAGTVLPAEITGNGGPSVSGSGPPVENSPAELMSNGLVAEKPVLDSGSGAAEGQVIMDGLEATAGGAVSQAAPSAPGSLSSLPPASVLPSPRKSPTPLQQQSMGPGVIPRKPSYRSGDRAIDIAEEPIHHHEQHSYHDDDDGSERKYVRRGTLYTQLLRHVAPFWGSAIQVLPVTAPQRKDDRESNLAEDGVEGRWRRRTQQSRRPAVDPRKLLLVVAITACLATMMLLYFRLAQASLASSTVQVGQER